jgi:nanoRNase/pAp phosphatase (c-di-AMP/oligoRNAs hydrolase)
LFGIGEFNGSIVICGRATHFIVDIGKILQEFGGAGHPTAG